MLYMKNSFKLLILDFCNLIYFFLQLDKLVFARTLKLCVGEIVDCKMFLDTPHKIYSCKCTKKFLMFNTFSPCSDFFFVFFRTVI